MRWLVYGQSWRGAMPYSANRALRAMGHDTTVFDPARHLISRTVRGKLGTAADLIFFRYNAWRVNRALRAALAAARYDAVLVFKGAHLWPQTVRWAAQRCRWVVNWNWDDFFNPVPYHYSPFMAGAFREYGMILTARTHLAREYLDHGARRVERMDFCFDPSIHYPVKGEGDLGDVAFFGTWSPDRERVLSRLESFRIGIWGSSWKRAAAKFRGAANVRIALRPAECEAMSRELNAHRIGLNLLTRENRDLTNLRLYEIPACGAFQLCERTDAVRAAFEEGKEIECFGSLEELIDKCRFYVAHEDARRAVSGAGYRRLAHGGHTYVDRMTSLVRLLDND